MRHGVNGGFGATATAVDESRGNGASVSVAQREIPYDYVATFKLTGTRGTRAQDVISISTEGSFVAVSVGYSFLPAQRKLASPPPIPAVLEPVLNGLFGAGAAAGAAFASFAEAGLVRFSGFHFLYTIVDSGSGRELQNKSVHSIAGLGSADGERPFRPFARPVAFVPRATIRIEIEELSEGPLFRDGTLFVVLHGYKRLGE